MIKCWIEKDHGKWVVVWESHLFRGYQSRSLKKCKTSQAAVEYARSAYGPKVQLDIVFDKCLLPPITPDVRSNYIDKIK